MNTNTKQFKTIVNSCGKVEGFLNVIDSNNNLIDNEAVLVGYALNEVSASDDKYEGGVKKYVEDIIAEAKLSDKVAKWLGGYGGFQSMARSDDWLKHNKALEDIDLDLSNEVLKEIAPLIKRCPEAVTNMLTNNPSIDVKAIREWKKANPDPKRGGRVRTNKKVVELTPKEAEMLRAILTDCKKKYEADAQALLKKF